MREMATAGQVESHDPIMRLQHGGVHGEVCRAAGIWLHIHTPLRLIKAESIQCTLFAQIFNLVNDLIAPIVPGAGLTRKGVCKGVRKGVRKKVFVNIFVNMFAKVFVFIPFELPLPSERFISLSISFSTYIYIYIYI